MLLAPLKQKLFIGQHNGTVGQQGQRLVKEGIENNPELVGPGNAVVKLAVIPAG